MILFVSDQINFLHVRVSLSMSLTSFSAPFHTLGMNTGRKHTSTREEEIQNYRESLISFSLFSFIIKCILFNQQREQSLHDFIIDGTERECQRPSDPSEQKDFYSGKQKAHTYNNIVIVGEHAQTVEYLSQTYEGTYHDKAICDEEQYAFPENSTLQKDRGFQGYEPENVITYQPKKATERHALDRR